MDGKTVLTFAGLAFFGTVFGTLIPENACKNALKALLSLTVTAAVIGTVAGLDITDAVRLDRKAADLDKVYTEAGAILAQMTEEQTAEWIAEYTGIPPKYVRCYTDWTGEKFILSGLVAECECENPDGVRGYLASKLGVDGSVINIAG